MLKERSVYPLQVRQARRLANLLRGGLRFGRGQGVSNRDLAAFTRQFGTLINASIPYDTALRMVRTESSNPFLQTVLDDVRARVVEGSYLADAMAVYPRVFPPMMVNMVHSGERSGTLGLILDRLANHFETVGRLRNRIAAALVYPIFMMLFSMAVVVFMFVEIIPKITSLYENFGGTLPLPTRILIALSDVVVGYWWLLLPGAVGLGFGVSWFFRTEAGRNFKDRLELRVPVWRTFRRKVLMQRLSESLATMLKSGVDLDQALGVSSEVMENRIYLNAVKDAIFDIQNKGMQFSVALRRSGLFPEEVCQMVAIGEETATLDVMLENVANRLTQEVNTSLDAALALFEPVMILFMGSVVGFIVISVLLPILNQNQLLG